MQCNVASINENQIFWKDNGMSLVIVYLSHFICVHTNLIAVQIQARRNLIYFQLAPYNLGYSKFDGTVSYDITIYVSGSSSF